MWTRTVKLCNNLSWKRKHPITTSLLQQCCDYVCNNLKYKRDLVNLVSRLQPNCLSTLPAQIHVASQVHKKWPFLIISCWYLSGASILTFVDNKLVIPMNAIVSKKTYLFNCPYNCCSFSGSDACSHFSWIS